MADSTAYSFRNVQATLDGQTVQGLWEGDDAIMFDPSVDVGTMMKGVDGSALFSQSTDDSAQITIKLQHTSPTHRLLQQRLARQRQAGGLVGFPFDFIDTRSGEGGSSDRCYIMREPSRGMGQNATVREWVIVAGTWEHLIPNAVQS